MNTYNIKLDLINEVLIKMNEIINNDQLHVLKNQLNMVLYNYTVTKITTTEVAVINGNTTYKLFEYFKIGKLGSGKSQKTIEQYKRVVCQLCNMVHKELDEIITDDIQYFLVKYKELYNVSDCTMDSKRRYLSSVFGYLTKHHKIKDNPMDLIEKISYRKCIKQPLEDDEVKIIKDSCKDNARDLAIIQFFLNTGVRVSELCGIKMKDVDFNKGRCKVLGKGNKERVVTFSQETKEYLKKYLEQRGDINFRLKQFDNNTPLFVTNKAPYNKLHKNTVEAMVKRLGKISGITRIHPHLLRASYATNLSKLGLDINIIAKVLGHSGLNTVQRYVLVDNNYIESELRRVGYAS